MWYLLIYNKFIIIKNLQNQIYFVIKYGIYLKSWQKLNKYIILL